MTNPPLHCAATGCMCPVESQLSKCQWTIITKWLQQVAFGGICPIPEDVIFRLGNYFVHASSTWNPQVRSSEHMSIVRFSWMAHIDWRNCKVFQNSQLKGEGQPHAIRGGPEFWKCDIQHPTNRLLEGGSRFLYIWHLVWHNCMQ